MAASEHCAQDGEPRIAQTNATVDELEGYSDDAEVEARLAALEGTTSS